MKKFIKFLKENYKYIPVKGIGKKWELGIYILESTDKVAKIVQMQYSDSDIYLVHPKEVYKSTKGHFIKVSWAGRVYIPDELIKAEKT